VLDKDGKDPRFICFNEPIGIGRQFSCGDYTCYYKRIPCNACRVALSHYSRRISSQGIYTPEGKIGQEYTRDEGIKLGR